MRDLGVTSLISGLVIMGISLLVPSVVVDMIGTTDLSLFASSITDILTKPILYSGIGVLAFAIILLIFYKVMEKKKCEKDKKLDIYLFNFLFFCILGICFVKKTFTRTNVCDILNTPKIEGDDMKILKGYVFRMYPTEKQEELINKTIGCSRFVYNYFLDDKIKEYKKTGKSKSVYDQIKLIPSLSKEYPFLKEVDSCALRTSLFNLEDAYKRFFNGNGYP